jgi:hypothetical protein
MAKKIEQTLTNKILDVTTAMQEFGASTAADMIEKLVEEEKQISYDKGMRHGYDLANYKKIFFFTLLGLPIVMYLAIIGCNEISNINANDERLNITEMTACISGNHDPCYAGYIRNTLSDNPEPKRAQAYVEAYKLATGRYLK